MDKMYATWSTYNIVTNMGAKLEALSITGSKIMSAMSSPASWADARAYTVINYNGNNGGTISDYARGARPVLYEQIIMNM